MRLSWSSLWLAVAFMGWFAPVAWGDDGAAKAKETEVKAKELAVAGLWHGSYAYPEGSFQPETAFTLVLFQDGKELAGIIHEPNSFGGMTAPFLHATLKGTWNPETRTFQFTKSYDGTSSVSHDVEYKGAFNEEGTKVDVGTWSIAGFDGTFKMKQDEKVKPGKLTGTWRGTNEPPAGTEIPAVGCTMVLLHKGDEIVGFVQEPRAAADGTNPWFHATIQGTFDEKSGEVKLKKTYDGTAGATHEEEYIGKLTDGDTPSLSGKRRHAKGEDAGRFTLTRQPAAK